MNDTLWTPDEWMKFKHPGIRIMDPDGWRGAHGRPFTDAISEDEFDRRFVSCTIVGLDRLAMEGTT